MYSYLVSEMKHIQKDYKVKMHIPRDSANQNVMIVGERNDEDHAVPSGMKLLGKLIDWRRARRGRKNVKQWVSKKKGINISLTAKLRG